MELAKLPQYLELIRNLPTRTFINLVYNYPCYILKKFLRIRYTEKKVNNYRMLLDLQDQGISKELMLYLSDAGTGASAHFAAGIIRRHGDYGYWC